MDDHTSARFKSYHFLKVVSGGRAPGKSSSFASSQLLGIELLDGRDVRSLYLMVWDEEGVRWRREFRAALHVVVNDGPGSCA